MPTVSAYKSQQAGVQADLKQMWKSVVPAFQEQQKLLIKFLPESTIRTTTYAFKDAVPFPSLWTYGSARTQSTFQDRSVSMGIVPYQLSIPFSHYDDLDDQLGDLREHVQMGVQRYAQLPDVLISEYFNAVPNLNPSLLKAYDGSDLFSNLDGDGQNRLGVLGGNIISGSGLTVAGVVSDIAKAQRRFLDMVDPTARKPIYRAEDVAFTKLHVIGPNTANEVLQKAAKSENIRIDPANTVSESNYIMGTFSWHLSPYLTDPADLYVVVDHPFWKPFIFRGPGTIESIMADSSNSDRARETNEYCFYTSMRCRLGVMMPACIIKINN